MLSQKYIHQAGCLKARRFSTKASRTFTRYLRDSTLDGRYEYAAVDGKAIVYCEGGGQHANESCAVPDLLP